MKTRHPATSAERKTTRLLFGRELGKVKSPTRGVCYRSDTSGAPADHGPVRLTRVIARRSLLVKLTLPGGRHVDMSAEKEFSGRIAVVTGGGSGIGEAICHVLAEKGARVVVADINVEAAKRVSRSLPGSDKEIEYSVKVSAMETLVAGDQGHLAVEVDVGESASVERLFEVVREQSGGTPVSIVINNAGIGTAFASIADSSEEDFDRVIKTNLKVRFKSRTIRRNDI
ncbi:hypothetical protein HPB52_016697 [Rhipicephalus sanguineus]|uniref:SDR family NAD(P)-dependent oxidoreductase n=1 Tax=Rhipicephalus sanguineus TaxID=34632 RepID=A0A9D4Q106_RHISA|nr:hypothetical protein HPB52_016697 [Rhipicephalus sanguineus]